MLVGCAARFVVAPEILGRWMPAGSGFKYDYFTIPGFIQAEALPVRMLCKNHKLK
jgi:hypothetical protein